MITSFDAKFKFLRSTVIVQMFNNEFILRVQACLKELEYFLLFEWLIQITNLFLMPYLNFQFNYCFQVFIDLKIYQLIFFLISLIIHDLIYILTFQVFQLIQ